MNSIKTFEVIDQIIELKQKINKMSSSFETSEIEDNIKEHVERVFGKTLFPPFGVKGWTPGFNDGDPCLHSSEATYGYDDLDCEGIPIPDYEEVQDVPDIEAVEQDPEMVAMLNKLLSQIETLMEAVYGTDFYCVVYRDRGKNNEVNVDLGHYDCEY